jgi:hypothetical protein
LTELPVPEIDKAISEEEGYDRPGSVPNRDNNPGDLRHSPHSSHTTGDPDGIGHIDNPLDGWEDLIRQLNLYVVEEPTITVGQAIYKFAPQTENNSASYLEFVLSKLPGCTADTLLSDALKIPGGTVSV